MDAALNVSQVPTVFMRNDIKLFLHTKSDAKKSCSLHHGI